MMIVICDKYSDLPEDQECTGQIPAGGYYYVLQCSVTEHLDYFYPLSGQYCRTCMLAMVDTALAREDLKRLEVTRLGTLH